MLSPVPSTVGGSCPLCVGWGRGMLSGFLSTGFQAPPHPWGRAQRLSFRRWICTPVAACTAAPALRGWMPCASGRQWFPLAVVCDHHDGGGSCFPSAPRRASQCPTGWCGVRVLLAVWLCCVRYAPHVTVAGARVVAAERRVCGAVGTAAQVCMCVLSRGMARSVGGVVCSACGAVAVQWSVPGVSLAIAWRVAALQCRHTPPFH